MRINFRQGIVSHQTGFLQASGTTVNLLADNKPTTVTLAHKGTNYIHSEDRSVTGAWTGLTGSQSGRYWLYWDFNLLTFAASRSFTDLEPIQQSSAPTHGNDSDGIPWLTDGRMWYDTDDFIHYEYNGGSWFEVLRVFAGVSNGTLTPTSMSQDAPLYTGTQIGNTTSTRAGRVLFGETGRPILRDNNTFFTTEDQFFTNQSRVDALRLESNVSRAASASGSLSAFGVVAWTDDGKVSSATYPHVGSTVVGILTENIGFGEVGAIIVQGTVTNPAWTWITGDGVSVGAPLWVDAGALVTTDPYPLSFSTKQVPVARVLADDTIVFEQGLGGVGPQGPRGLAGASPAATTTTLGSVVLSATASGVGSPPSIDEAPVVVETNDSRLSDARTPLAHVHDAVDVRYIPEGGDIVSVNLQAAVTELDVEKLSKAGGTMTGTLVLNGDPATDLEAATKQYVDNGIAAIPTPALNDLTDVIVAGSPAVSGDVLTFNGTSWVNAASSGGGSGNWLDANGGVDFTVAPNATGTNAIALGNDASTSADSTIAIGASATATGLLGVAVGNAASAAVASTAVGRDAQATANSACAFGTDSDALADSSIAIGRGTYARSQRDICIGEYANTAAGGARSVVIGKSAVTPAAAYDSVAIGTDASTSSFSIAIGKDVTTSGGSSVGIGYGSNAVGTFDVVIGRFCSTVGAGAQSSVAIGNNSDTAATRSIAIGYGNDTSLEHQIAIGSNIASTTVDSDVTHSVKIGHGLTGANKNMLHLYNKGKLELYGDEAMFVFPNYYAGGSPNAFPANPEEGGVIYDYTNKNLSLYNGTAWSAVGGGGGLGDLTVTSIPASDTITSTKETFALDTSAGTGLSLNYTAGSADSGYDIAGAVFIGSGGGSPFGSGNSYTKNPDPGGVSAGWVLSDGGTKVWYMNAGASGTSKTVYEATLSTPYDVSSAGTATGISVTTNGANGSYFGRFNDDGTKMYINHIVTGPPAGYEIEEYDLSVAYDISTATYSQTSIPLFETGDTDNRLPSFSEDGKYVYVANITTTTRVIHQYTLGTAWDVSTLTHTNTLDVTANVGTNDANVAISNDGTKIFVAQMDGAFAAADVHQYNLSTAYDITSGTYDSTNGLPGEFAYFIRDFSFDVSGTRLYLYDDDYVFQFDISAGDAGTAGSSTSLYHDDVAKLTTTADGIDVTNTIESTSTLLNVKANNGLIMTGEELPDFGFDVPSITATGNSASFTPPTNASDMEQSFIREDGLAIYNVDHDVSPGIVYEFLLGTAWDISTKAGTPNASFTMSSGDHTGIVAGVWFSPDGLKFIVSGQSDYSEYSMATPYDIANATFVQSVSAIGYFPSPLYFSQDGSYAYEVVRHASLNQWYVIQLAVGTPWDVSTIAQVGAQIRIDTDFPTSNEPYVAINNDGTKLIAVGDNTSVVTDTSIIHEYDLGTPYDISTMVINSNEKTLTGSRNYRYPQWSIDGTKFFVMDNNKTIRDYTSTAVTIGGLTATLYHDGNEKLGTRSTGVEVTGNLSASGMFIAPPYTLATLPAVVEGGMIYVTDATGSGVTGSMCFGNATGSPAAWIDMTTGIAVV